MKIKWLGVLLGFLSISCQSQPPLPKALNNNTLLWEISGKGLKQSSYVFGTMHMLCPEDAKLSLSMQLVLDRVKELYFEVDMDNMVEIFGSISAMAMKEGTKLSDLLTTEEYERVKNYFDGKLPLPFAMMENYKPMLLSAMIEEQMSCTNGYQYWFIQGDGIKLLCPVTVPVV